MLRIRNFARFGIAIVLTAGALAMGTAPEPSSKLVVLIVIDQMRADYLTRFADLYQGGLKRFMEKGAIFTEAHHDHALPGTAAGHATIATGVFPSRHGIPSNKFWDRTEASVRASAEDTSASIIGFPDRTGRAPTRLRREGVSDWLKRDSPASKVYSVAGKDRAAVLLAGQSPDGAYWYHKGSGRFVTSTYYTDTYPDWVEEFNQADYPYEFFADGWTKLLDDTAYARSREDSFPPEALGRAFSFPHAIVGEKSLAPKPYSAFAITPFADAVALRFAQELVVAERLGADETVDLLLLGMSAGDLIGHDFGPMSQEMQDYFLRIDRSLGEFFAFLDSEIGIGSYTAVLTADHGAPYIPEENRRLGVDAGRVTLLDLRPVLVPALLQALFDRNLDAQPRITMIFPFGLTMSFPDGTVTEDDMRAIRRVVADSLLKAAWVADVFTYDELADSETPDRPHLEAYRRNFVPDRAPDVMVHFKENYFFSDELAVEHGTPYRYDTHVPLIFMGPGIDHARYDERVTSVDIAPTLASLLGVETPGDLDGHVLRKIVP